MIGIAGRTKVRQKEFVTFQGNIFLIDSFSTDSLFALPAYDNTDLKTNFTGSPNL